FFKPDVRDLETNSEWIVWTRKRDSVTDDDVVVAVAGLVSSTGRHNSRHISSLNAVVVGNLDLLPGKAGRVGSDTVFISAALSQSSTNTGKPYNQNRTKCKNGKAGVSTTAAVWRSRCSKGFAFFTGAFSVKSCVWSDELSSSSKLKRVRDKNEEDVKEDTQSEINQVRIIKNVNVVAALSDLQPEQLVVGSSENCLSLGTTKDRPVETKTGVIVATNSSAPTASSSTAPLENCRFDNSAVANVGDTSISSNCELLGTGTANSKIMRGGIYHEKQIKSLCALHALNNLIQDGKAFKQEDLDKICSELDPNSWVNPHKSVFGLGNYDINVIMTALQQKQLEAIWFDKRKDPSEELNFENIYGFILNIPSDCRLGWLALPIKRKHWVAIRNLPSITERDAGRNNYYNLDSKFDKPESIGTTDNLVEYLRGELKSPEKELFLVVTEDVGRVETWRKNPPPCTSATASGANANLLPVPTSSDGPDASAGSGNNRRTSNDSGVVDLLPDLKDINVVDLNKEDLMRRQSSGVWSDMN
ncbi:Josephin-like protein, partial [Orchesella cincta]